MPFPAQWSVYRGRHRCCRCRGHLLYRHRLGRYGWWKSPCIWFWSSCLPWFQSTHSSHQQEPDAFPGFLKNVWRPIFTRSSHRFLMEIFRKPQFPDHPVEILFSIFFFHSLSYTTLFRIFTSTIAESGLTTKSRSLFQLTPINLKQPAQVTACSLNRIRFNWFQRLF